MMNQHIYRMSIDTQSKEILTLKMVRDFFQKFDDIVEEMSTFKDKYGMDLKDGLDRISAPDALNNLIKALEKPEKIGMLLIATNSLSLIDEDLKNFIYYDKDQLIQFRKKLREIVDNFNKIVK